MLYLVFLILLSFDVALTKEYDVIIVGAGLSGLGAGKYFTDQNVTNFIMLEAQDYIGGRMKSSSFANETISLGAGWIHGAYPSNSMFRLANKYNLKRFNDSAKVDQIAYRYRSNGSEVDKELARRRDAETVELHYEAVEIAERKVGRDEIDVNMETALRYKGFTAHNALDYAFIFQYYFFHNAVSPAEVSSTKCGILGEEGFDQLITDKRGYFYPVHEETKSFHNKIKLNTEVKKIERLANGSFIVTTANGATYLSKFVLVTVSSGVLIANAITFSPPLPSWKVEAINMVPMVHYCKIFLRFSDSFWDTNKDYIIFATTFDRQYIHWQNYDVDGIFKGKSILVATLVGDDCRNSLQLSDDEIKTQVYEALKKVYQNATGPIDIKRNDFSNNPFVRGAYSNQVPGITENHYLSLEHPVQQRLYFAGEHLGRSNYGYAHKAYDIGMNMSKQIILCLQQHICASDKPNFKLQMKCTSTASISASLQAIFIFGFALFSILSISG